MFRKLIRIRAGVALSCCWLLLAGLSYAEEPEGTEETIQLSSEQQAQVDAFLAAKAALDDPAFEQFVEIEMIREAYESLEVDMLVDGALQLAEGERILLRNHRSGITASELLSFAISVAADRGQNDAFERLTQAAQAVGDESLSDKVSAAQRLAGEARSAEHGLGAHAWLAPTIQDVKLRGDSEDLVAVESDLPAELTAQQASVVKELISDARRAIDNDLHLSGPLKKLAAPSRLTPLRPRITSLTTSPASLKPNTPVLITCRIDQPAPHANAQVLLQTMNYKGLWDVNKYKNIGLKTQVTHGSSTKNYSISGNRTIRLRAKYSHWSILTGTHIAYRNRYVTAEP